MFIWNQYLSFAYFDSSGGGAETTCVSRVATMCTPPRVKLSTGKQRCAPKALRLRARIMHAYRYERSYPYGYNGCTVSCGHSSGCAVLQPSTKGNSNGSTLASPRTWAQRKPSARKTGSNYLDPAPARRTGDRRSTPMSTAARQQIRSHAESQSGSPQTRGASRT